MTSETIPRLRKYTTTVPYVNPNVSRDRLAWAYDNSNENFICHVDRDGKVVTYHFVLEADAVAFKLRWG